MPMSTTKDLFETEPCPRCGGSGLYSYCDRWGTTCFECGVQPKSPGLGRRSTKRGKAAWLFYMEQLPQRAAADLQPGDRVWDLQAWRTVVEVRPSLSARKDPVTGDWIADYVDVVTQRVTLVFPRGYLFRLRPTEAERQAALEAALAYQGTLTKAGRPAKRPKKL